MKGMVFTELLEMVESKFGLAMVERIISAADTANGGAYTAVGTYDHAELLRLVIALSGEIGVPVAQLEFAFGQYLFGRFSQTYGRFFAGVTSAFDFLTRVQDYVHVEVLKLYPDAELPNFYCERENATTLIMLYESHRPFADLADGLIAGCIAHYGQSIRVQREPQPAENGLHRERFVLTQGD